MWLNPDPAILPGMPPWKRLRNVMISLSLIGAGFVLYSLSYGPCGGGIFTLIPGAALGLTGIITLLMSLGSYLPSNK